MPVDYCLFWIQSACMPRDDWAAWVEAVGTALAVLVAGLLFYFQRRHEERVRSAEHERAAKAANADRAHRKKAIDTIVKPMEEEIATIFSHRFLEFDTTSTAKNVREIAESCRLAVNRLGRFTDVVVQIDPAKLLIVLTIEEELHRFLAVVSDLERHLDGGLKESQRKRLSDALKKIQLNCSKF